MPLNPHRRRSGFTLIELMIVVAVLAIIAVLAIPALLRARMASNEASALSSLRTLNTMSENYRTRLSTYPSALTDMSNEGFIDTNLGSGLKSGYTYTYTGTPPAFSCNADPQSPGQTGERYFFVDTTGVIRFSTTGTANSASTPVGN